MPSQMSGRAHRSVVDRYSLDSIDLDIEGADSSDPTVADRRAAAIAALVAAEHAAGRCSSRVSLLPASTRWSWTTASRCPTTARWPTRPCSLSLRSRDSSARPRRTLPAGSYPSWRSRVVDQGGDRVLLGRVGYQAEWWTQGDRPDAHVATPYDSPWQLITQ
jgi:hypothetical protein